MRARSGARPPAGARPPRPSLAESVCLALVFLTPVFFYRGTQEIFEVPKVALLVTGALALAAGALAGLLAAVAGRGPGALAESAARLGSLPRRDPLGFGVVLYLGSCVVST